MAGANDLALMQAMLPYAQPGTYPTIRRSQYLADALSDLREKGGDNIRTPTALWGKLGAQAILQQGRDRNFKDLDRQLRGDMKSTVGAMTAGIPGWGDQPAAPMGPQSAPGQMPPMQGNPIGAQPPGMNPPPVQQAPLPAPQQSSIPMTPVPPEMIETAKRMINSGNPVLMQQGMEMVAKIRQMAMTPIDPSKPAFVSDGQGGFAVRDYGKEVTSEPGPKPGTMIQRRKATGEIEIKDTGIMGSPEPGSVYDPAMGGFAKLPTTVGGRNMPFGAMSPEQVNTVVKKISDGKQVTNYMTLRSKAASALMPEGPENNATDLNLIDVANTALANNPDLAVSEGFFKTVQEAQGGMNKFIADMRNNVSQGGLLNQEYRNRLKKVIAASLHHRYDAAKQEIDTYRPGLEAIGLGDQADAVLAQLAPPVEYKPGGMPTPAPGGGPMPPASAPPGSFTPPPAKAVEFLRNNPQTAAAFDAKYGAGAARQILGGR